MFRVEVKRVQRVSRVQRDLMGLKGVKDLGSCLCHQRTTRRREHFTDSWRLSDPGCEGGGGADHLRV
jgi:hypothetical protein